MSAWIQDSLEQLGFSTAPVRSQVGIAVLEAVANAMIHGNLEIESSLRRESPEAFDALVAERRGLAPYAQRRVRCVARQSQKRVEYTISDEGNGFDPSELPDPDSPQSLHDVAGRGIHLIRTFMDSVVHNDRGTEITMSREVPDPDAPPEPPLAGSDKAAPVRGKPVR
jgi:anti-sigma regulatory factor (Ser/Thr protein kinase)